MAAGEGAPEEGLGKGGFDYARCVAVVEAFVGLQGGACEVQRILNLCPGIRTLLAGRKVVAFLEGFPEKFALDRGRDRIVVTALDPAAKQRSYDDLPEDIRQHLKFEQEDHYTEELLRALVAGVVTFTTRHGTKFAPMRWLFAHRSIPKYLKSWAHTHPNPAWQYHLQPGYGGHENEGRAKTAAGLQYLRHFITLHAPKVFLWASPDEADTDSEKVAPIPAPASGGDGVAALASAERVGLADGHEAHMPTGPRRSDHVQMKHDRGALALESGPGNRVAKRKADAMAKAGSEERGTGAVTVGAGDTLLVTRVSTRTKDLNRLEVLLMAEWCGFPTAAAPKELRAGLYVLREGDTVAEDGAASGEPAWGGVTAPMGAFLSHLPRVTSVRRCARVLCATEAFAMAPALECDGFIASVKAALAQNPRYAAADTTFHLDCDTHYPEAHNKTLPFYDMSSYAHLLFKLYAAIGPARMRDTSASADVSLVVVAVKDLLVLAEQAHGPLSTAVGFHAMWEKRPFIFTGTMEPNVGTSVASVCGLVWAVDAKQRREAAARAKRQKTDEPVDAAASADEDLCPPVVLDACCGSGTLAAASAYLGAKKVYGFELRADFAARIPQNFTHAGLGEDVFAICHDCTEPVPATGRLPPPSLVLCNAPWGKKFGASNDCEKVIRGVLTQHPSAVVCFIIPRASLDVVRRDFPHLTVVHSVAIGTISLIVVRQPPPA
eukprot:TRINITY_DN2365_c0_g1_i1.p1 TRINITY_DN2365_c0_g1~~TRINITY_DN2365_c0_g1_i1.p1  ORF type:complete len:720 (+),score=216.59 TRINITY_DN2365_c0_g1_i1:65-2224(+)